ncbi:MAG: Hsp20/alpha crystallin family protein [Polyangiales bacterium]
MQVETNTPTQQRNEVRASAPLIERRVVPPIDVYENEDEFVLIADVPGLGEDNLELAFEKDVLSIQGRAELFGAAMQYKRAIAIPETVNSQAIDASLEHGVLRVRLPKRAELKPRRIKVRAS